MWYKVGLSMGVLLLSFGLVAAQPGTEATSWLTTNNNGGVRGPINIPEGARVVEVQVKEQAGYGVTDMRFGYRRFPAAETNYTAWGCPGSNGSPRSVTIPHNRILAGMDLKEQGGYGVIDVRLYLRDITGHPMTNPMTDWACNSPEEARICEGRLPIRSIVTGFELREQGGYGVVNVRLRYVPFR
jgi:hypothetical protein